MLDILVVLVLQLVKEALNVLPDTFVHKVQLILCVALLVHLLIVERDVVMVYQILKHIFVQQEVVHASQYVRDITRLELVIRIMRQKREIKKNHVNHQIIALVAVHL